MNEERMEAIRTLAAEKGMAPEVLMGALADALETAYKRMPGSYEYAWVTMDPITGEMRVTAQELDEDGEPFGPELDVTPDQATLGRIAAQTFKQVMMQ
ncbi:MAG: transcription termination/antitermination protein NusA, partial [Acidimicrobiales bacterium]|nr:transcription termination/antitermination protein NusA [Acidimicrobiales bacterium]